MDEAAFEFLMRNLIAKYAVQAWRCIPGVARERAKHYWFRTFPSIFRHFKSYESWASYNYPDGMHGSGQITDDQLSKKVGQAAQDKGPKIIVVSHDAQAFGAQFLALGMARTLKEDLSLNVVVVLLGGGTLKEEFCAIAPVVELNQIIAKDRQIKELAQQLVASGFTKAIVNSLASGRIVPIFKESGIECICLVHEMPGAIRSLGLAKQAKLLASHAEKVIFPAEVVAEGFEQFAHIEATKKLIRPQGLYRKNKWRSNKVFARAELRKQLGLPPESKVVLAVGQASYRKGVDLFVACARDLLSKRTDVEFIWIGPWEKGVQEKMEKLLSDVRCENHVHFLGFEPDTSLYHAGADIYILTSREDPFPNVVLESFEVGVPVITYAHSGGAVRLIRDTGGIIVDELNGKMFSSAISGLLDFEELATTIGKAEQDYVDQHFSFTNYLTELCSMLGINMQPRDL